MTYTSRIPEKVSRLSVSTTDTELDTNGLDALIKTEGDVMIKTDIGTSSFDAFVLSDGESLEFCGRIFVSAATSATLNVMLFRTV